MRIVMILLISFFLVSCTSKVPSFALNPNAFNTQGELKQKSLYTYSPSESKITGYFFSESSTSNELEYTNMIVYIPIDYTGQLYGPFSNVTWALNRYTDDSAKTLEEAFENSIRENGNKRLFKTKKEEYLVDTKLARNLTHEIQEFERKIERQEDNDEEEIIIP